jgi:hypothetical protein
MSKCNSKKNNCNKKSDDIDKKHDVTNLAENASLGRKKATDESQEGYNFMGTLNQWTTLDEQETKVKEIEKVTEREKNNVKEIENNNRGQWTKK